ncbi:hypothetical protein DSL72_008390 [Monilinia vaccinii-corymbosi]|uniref:Uncharacterized protein n=1 Tax=Monilinia vaccinii-corymbosi TaxID=61207 RepID=A0A8A3PK90_9HELO|nr:hypothetical protein DSL72_008390 [Monilinia vaccinii-corymbosi]
MPSVPTIDDIKVPSVPTIDDIKMLFAVLSQFTPNNKPFPSPNHMKLAQDLGLRDRNVSKALWFRLVKKVKTGEFGDFGDLIVEKQPVESPAKKRSKSGDKSGKGKGKKQAGCQSGG